MTSCLASELVVTATPFGHGFRGRHDPLQSRRGAGLWVLRLWKASEGQKSRSKGVATTSSLAREDTTIIHAHGHIQFVWLLLLGIISLRFFNVVTLGSFLFLPMEELIPLNEYVNFAHPGFSWWTLGLFLLFFFLTLKTVLLCLDVSFHGIHFMSSGYVSNGIAAAPSNSMALLFFLWRQNPGLWASYQCFSQVGGLFTISSGNILSF